MDKLSSVQNTAEGLRKGEFSWSNCFGRSSSPAVECKRNLRSLTGIHSPTRPRTWTNMTLLLSSVSRHGRIRRGTSYESTRVAMDSVFNEPITHELCPSPFFRRKESGDAFQEALSSI